MEVIYCMAIGYFLGCINPAYLISKIKGMDIREKGSGNAGASNALIVLGKTAGIFSALFDIAKAYASYILSEAVFPDLSVAGIIAGSFCIIGHIFPFYMGFRGGKGLASLAGTVLAYSPLVFLILLLIEAVIAFAGGYICFVPMSASVIFTVYYGVHDGHIAVTALLSVIAVIINLKHIPNIRRIAKGTEIRLSYLWNKEKEMERTVDKPEKTSEH